MLALASYDPAWPARFEAEARCIRGLLGELALRIEHVGSTAVPGLDAKPVVDIQVSLASLEPLNDYVERLAGIGYSHVKLGAFDRVYPFFQKPAVWPSTHHVHLCVAGSELECRHLAFRDYLRVHPQVAAEYVTLKRKLASVACGDDIEAQERYSLAKSDFVNAVVEWAVPMDRIVAFLTRIGIPPVAATIGRPSLLPGIDIVAGELHFERSRVIWPGDLLHEAGHIAVTPAKMRRALDGALADAPDAPFAGEVEATAWAYAAVVAAELEPSILFHPGGYHGASERLIFAYGNGMYAGVAGLCAAGMAASREEVLSKGLPAYPTMLRWLR